LKCLFFEVAAGLEKRKRRQLQRGYTVGLAKVCLSYMKPVTSHNSSCSSSSSSSSWAQLVTSRWVILC